jgi:restriction system protein
MALWLVRAGKHGEREDFALQNKVAVIGWEEFPDISYIQARSEFHTLLHKTFPDEKPNTLRNWEGQLWPFFHEIKKGDLIALPLKHRAVIAIGEADGEDRYEPNNPPGARHFVPVKSWHEFPRNAFETDLLYSFGALKTVCRIQRNQAEERVKAILSGKKVVAKISNGDEDEKEESLPDLEQLARDQIVNYIERRFKGDKLAYLVEAILIAQGYQTRVSPKGADGGVDILAGKGVLGFETPRLAVQVKSWDAPIDIKVFNELQGAMASFGAELGLIVAWGGYKSTVEKEAARHFFKMRIWDADILVQMIQENYGKLPAAIQAELPLKRIWTLVQEEDEE